MSQVIRNATLNVMATLIAAAAGFATSAVTARVLGPDAFGEFSLLIWVLTTAALLGDGMSSTMEKFTAELEGARLRAAANRLGSTLSIAQAALGVTAGLLLISLSPQVAGALKQPAVQPLVAVVGLGVPLALIGGVMRARLAGFQRYDLVSGVIAVASLATLGGTLLLLHHDLGVAGLIWLAVGVYGVRLLLLGLPNWRWYRPRPPGVVSRALRQRALRYCGGAFAISAFDAVIWQRSESFFLGRYSTVDQVGYYGLAFGISCVAATMLPLAASGVLMPALSHRLGAGERGAMQQLYAAAAKYVGMLGIPLCLGGIALARRAVELVYGNGYAPVVWPLRILLASGAVIALAGPTSALILALGKPYLAALWGVPIAILDLGLGYALAGPYGAVGAAVANATCQVLGVTAGIAYLSLSQRFRLPLEALVRTAAAAAASAGVAALLVAVIDGWAGLLAGILAALAAYVPALLVARALDSSDLATFRQIARTLPRRVGQVTERLVSATEATGRRLRGNFES